MNQYRKINASAKAYNFINAKLALPTNQPKITNLFNGKLVFLGFKNYGFQPMIKVLGTGNEEYFFFPKDVEQTRAATNYNRAIVPLPSLTNASPKGGTDMQDFRSTYTQFSNATGEFSPEDVQSAYKNSGSKMSFNEWIQSEQGKKLVNDSLQLAFQLINKNNPTNNQALPSQNTDEDNQTQKEFTILKMHPLTFTIVALSTAVIGIIAFSYLSNKKTLNVKK